MTETNSKLSQTVFMELRLSFASLTRTSNLVSKQCAQEIKASKLSLLTSVEMCFLQSVIGAKMPYKQNSYFQRLFSYNFLISMMLEKFQN